MNVEILNRLLASWWLALLIGLIHLAIRERAALHVMQTGLLKNHWVDYQSAKKKLLTALAYLVGGTLLMLTGWELSVDFMKLAAGLIHIPTQLTSIHTSVNIARQWLSVSAYLLANSLVMSGLLLVMSAGGRWLVNTAKFLVTFATLVVVGLLIVANLG